jgi:hypothetical protein
MHVFERAGLGHAPFRVVGVDYRRGPMHEPIGTCDFCGQRIAECWLIRSADGRRFVVCCDCVAKTRDVGSFNQVERMS